MAKTGDFFWLQVSPGLEFRVECLGFRVFYTYWIFCYTGSGSWLKGLHYTVISAQLAFEATTCIRQENNCRIVMTVVLLFASMV